MLLKVHISVIDFYIHNISQYKNKKDKNVKSQESNNSMKKVCHKGFTWTGHFWVHIQNNAKWKTFIVKMIFIVTIL